VAVTLSGCTDTLNHFTEMAIKDSPSLVFDPGFVIEISGKSVPIQGFDACPDAGPFMTAVFGPAPHSGEKSCIVLSKERTRVGVIIYLPSGAVHEEWRVVRGSGKTEDGRLYTWMNLLRPDGSPVIPAKS
jgi:hypothetical protein